MRIANSLINSASQFDDLSRMAQYLDNYPNGASSKTVKHFLQGIQTGVFAEYLTNLSTDNIKIARVDLSSVGEVAPIAFFYGANDLIANCEDVLKLAKEVKPVSNEMIRGGHATFLIGKDMTYFTRDVM